MVTRSSARSGRAEVELGIAARCVRCSPAGNDQPGDGVLYLVRLTVPRRGGWRAWGAVRGDSERGKAAQSPAVTGLRIDSEVRRGRDYVQVVIVATAEAADVAEALSPDLAVLPERRGRG